MFFVYVLESEKTGRSYIGSCFDLMDRLERHNSGRSKSTKHALPWNLVYYERFDTRAEAMRRERYFKTGAGRFELGRLIRTDECNSRSIFPNVLKHPFGNRNRRSPG